MRSSLVVDVHNLYCSAIRKFPGKVINYASLIAYLEITHGCEFFHRVAYGKQPIDKVRQFATMLQRNGFELHFGNTPHNVEMALKVAELVEGKYTDSIVLGTNYFEAGRLLKYAQSKGVYTTAFGFDLPQVFNQYAYCLEVSPEFMLDRPNGSENLEGEEETK